MLILEIVGLDGMTLILSFGELSQAGGTRCGAEIGCSTA
jgi:hypothetical protein